MTSPLVWLADYASSGQSRPLLWIPGGGAVSYAEFDDYVHALATALVDGGLEPGDRVVSQVPKSVASFALGWAVMRAGGVHVPLNPDFPPAEVAYFVEDADPVLFVDAEVLHFLVEYGVAPTARAAQKPGQPKGSPDNAEPGTLEAIVGPFDKLLKKRRSRPPRDPNRPIVFQIPPDDAPAAMIYTSGTTGRPKGAVLTHGALGANAEALRNAWHFTGRDILLHALPIFHVHGLFIAANTAIAAGASMLWQERFETEPAIHSLPFVTVVMGVPTFYNRMLSSHLLTREAPKHVRLFVSGSAPLSPATHREWLRRTGHRILERYGMTEAGVISSHLYDGGRSAGTVGRPLPGVEVRVVDPETGETLVDDQAGEIEVRSRGLFSGYWRDPDKTAESHTADGFFKTGDLGMTSFGAAARPGGAARNRAARLSGDDTNSPRELRIVGRSKDLVISGGYNIYPKEIEDALDAQPGVTESAVIGCPHPDFGEAVVALVIRSAGVMISEADLLIGLDQRLAGYQQPKRIFFVSELPRNAMGKVRKDALREEYAATFAE